ncbi:MAG: amidohydrolase family protein [Methylobacteriaceae bacterium]|jgi:dihydroorotase|nr:amidohydrolase family protein [Methylobacteriaceae bacterium]
MSGFIIRNGTLVDFEHNAVTTGDVYIQHGVIVEKDAFSGPVVEEFDATGKYVLPGLIDAHLHLQYDGSNGVHADIHCPANGVTTAVDAGSTGTLTFPLYQKVNALRYFTTVKSFITPAPWGVQDTLHAENMDPEAFSEAAVFDVYRNYADSLVGLKLRMDAVTLEDYGIKPLEKAVRIAEKVRAAGWRCILNVHCANLPAYLDISEIVNGLQPGDILVHCFQNRGQTMFDADGHILECARKARARGVYFDCCTGRIHWSFKNFRQALADGFPPDIISSDIIRESSYVKPGFSILHAMAALLASGMDELAILKAVTHNPAHILGIEREAGSLAAGRPADVVVLDVMEKDTRLFDRFGGETTAKRLFVPLMTIKKGEIVFRQIFY